MSDTHDDAKPSLEHVVEEARASFAQQIAKTRQALVDDHVRNCPQPASMPIPTPTDADMFAAFNNAITELVSLLDHATIALVETAEDNARARESLRICRDRLRTEIELAELRRLDNETKQET